MGTIAANDRMTPVYLATAGQVDFPVDFPAIAFDGDYVGLFATRTRDGVSTLLDLNDFSVVAPGVNGFTARLVAPAVAGDTLIFFGDLPNSRPRAHQAGGATRTEILEGDAAQLMAAVQELQRDAKRTVRAPIGEALDALGPPASRAGKFLGFDVSGSLGVIAGLVLPGLISIGEFMTTLLGSASAEAVRSLLGVPRYASLEYFARVAGITLGTGNDQPAFDAALTAMRAARLGNGLKVFIPDGVYNATSVRWCSRGGYFGSSPGAVTIRAIRGAGDASETYFAGLDTGVANYLYACDWVFENLDLDGRYDGSQTAWRDKQHGLVIVQAYSGVNDAAYRAASKIGGQTPRGRIAGVGVFNMGGDGVYHAGAGTNNFSFDVFEVGGVGFKCFSYDNNYGNIDIGSCGLQCFYGGPNCANNRWGPFKGWYAGQRGVAGARAGFELDRADQNVFSAISVQDPSGDGVILRRAFGNELPVHVQYQGVIPSMQAACSAVVTYGASYNRLKLTASIPGYAAQTYPNVTKLVRDLEGTDGTFASFNDFDILAQGWPADALTWNDDWFEGSATGKLPMSNRMRLNGVERVPVRWWQDVSGLASFGLQRSGSLVGLIAQTSGQVDVLTQTIGQLGWTNGTQYKYAVRWSGDASFAKLGFFDSAAVVKPTVTGSRGANAALASDVAAEAGLGLVTDTTS